VHGRLTAAKGSRRSLLRIVRRWYSLCWRLNNWLCSRFGNYWLCSGFSSWSLRHGSLFSSHDLFNHWCRFGNWCHFGNNFDWLLKDRIQDLASLSALLTE
jgi:hypothetical protein